MPYTTNAELPDHVHKYSVKKQSQWRHVFNAVYKKVLRETKSVKQSESRAFQAANSVLTKNIKKEAQSGIISHEEYFNFKIDGWLGNLKV